jgi:hypothetical protein
MVGHVPFTSDAVAATVDGRLVAVGGLAIVSGIPTGFLDLRDEARAFPVLMHKTALAILAKAKAEGRRRILAAYDPDDERAIRWLVRLGFRPVEDTLEAVMIWHPSA